MPTYDFRCPQGHVFEKFFSKISDSPFEVACPECGELATRQLSAGAGLLFKGSGFYLTDYGKNAHRKQGGSATASGGTSDSSGAGGEAKGGDGAKSGESKPAESKSSESKSSDSKSSESKSESKPAASKPAKPSGSGEG